MQIFSLNKLLLFTLLSTVSLTANAQIDSPSVNLSNANGTLSSANGGTGINNGNNTITLGGNLTTSGSNPITLTTTGSTNITLPTSGTLGAGTVTSIIAGTGLTGGPITSTGTFSSNAEQTVSFQPGLLSAIVNTKGSCIKFVKATTVDNLEATAITFSTCSPNPAVTMYECGTSSTCASSPITIGTVTLTAAGTIVDGTVTNPAIQAGDYVCWAISAGTCVAINISLTAQVHSN